MVCAQVFCEGEPEILHGYGLWDYHLTTRGSASQTVKSLVDKLLLKRTRSQVDRRIVYLDLTEQGRRLRMRIR